MKDFLLAGDQIIRIDTIDRVDVSEIDKLRISLYHSDKRTKVQGLQVIEILMILKPSVFEGRKFRWARNKWLVHNLFGHPLMQILAILRYRRLAMYVHDMTVPRPLDPG